MILLDQAWSRLMAEPSHPSSSIEINHKSFDLVKRSQIGAGAAIKIDHAVYQSAKSYGRQ